jgi:putative ABC transport system substrate-binding protein
VRRREVITLLSGAAAAWPLAARAQQGERMRRIGVLHSLAPENAEAQARNTAFLQGLQELGWTDRRNVSLSIRWGRGDADTIHKSAAELIALAPDVIMASGTVTVAPLLQATRTLPIIFAIVPDPVGSGFVESLARPGGNATGFTTFEFGIAAKWLEILKQVAPSVTRAAVIRDAAMAAGIGQFAAIQSVAPSFGVDLIPVNVRIGDEIERALAAFARSPNSGVIVTGSALAAVHRDLLIARVAHHRLPAVYYERNYGVAGGLISYGPDFLDQYRRAASYVDRILRGEKPADLPVQSPTKYELVINLKTAKALGLEVPPTLLARADEVIE